MSVLLCLILIRIVRIDKSFPDTSGTELENVW